ncbi:MAG: hypothetical protein RRC07_07130 [Anaerolineae bacterium]|nr:hypothetical protein [Anaerolineae bacterium]
MRKILVLTAVVVLVLALGVTAAFAQGPGQGQSRGSQGQVTGTAAQNAQRAQANGTGLGPVWTDGTALTIIADTLRLPEADVLAALQSGTTVADLAAAQGITVDTLVDALVADHAAALDDAVVAGTITADDAALMQARMVEMITLRLESGSFTGGMGYGNGAGAGLRAQNPDGTVQNMNRGAMRGQGAGMGAGLGAGPGTGDCIYN